MDNNPTYRKWVKARDIALERLHTNAQLRSADEMRNLLGEVLRNALNYYHQTKAISHSPTWGASPIHHFEDTLKGLFLKAADTQFKILTKLKINSFVLAKASQSEIMGQLLRREIVAKITPADIQKVVLRKSLAGGPALQRLEFYMDRLRRKIINAAQSSALDAPTGEEFLMDIARAFPKRRIVRKPKRILKPKLMEADRSDDDAEYSIDFIDDKAWSDALDDYMSQPAMEFRQPEYVVNIPITDGTIQKTTGDEVWYAWEFERDMVNEFVQSVRDGEIEAANDNGITDFVWIAVIDDKTDQCCAWRDGLLVSEIEKELADHEDEDAECALDGDGLAPPLHFNCRCALAPATDEIPEKPDDGGVEFDDWLMS